MARLLHRKDKTKTKQRFSSVKSGLKLIRKGYFCPQLRYALMSDWVLSVVFDILMNSRPACQDKVPCNRQISSRPSGTNPNQSMTFRFSIWLRCWHFGILTKIQMFWALLACKTQKLQWWIQQTIDQIKGVILYYIAGDQVIVKSLKSCPKSRPATDSHVLHTEIMCVVVDRRTVSVSKLTRLFWISFPDCRSLT